MSCFAEIKGNRRVCLPVLIVWMLAMSAWSASNVSVSPSSLVAGQGGWITVTADVVAGANVEITVLADFDGDGSRDAEDAIMRYYEVQDGVPPPMADSPKPGDENPTAEALTTRLDFWSPLTFAGNYLVIVDDGGASDSDTFVITQTPTGQSVSGVLRRQDASPVAGFVIGVSDDDWEWNVMTDATGAFTLQMPVGTHEVGGEAFGLLTNFDDASVVEMTLGSGQTLTGQDLTLYDGAYTISGRVVDTSTGLGIAYLEIGAETVFDYEDSMEMMSLSMTDASGYYSTPVDNAEWEVFIEGELTNERALAGGNCAEGIDVNSASVSNIDFGFSPAATYISGTVTRSSDGLPLAGYEVYADSYAGESAKEATYGTEAYGATRSDGAYIIFVAPGNWTVGIEDSSYLKNGFLRPPDQSVNPTTGVPALNIDFALEAPSATINVTVVEDVTSAPVVGVRAWVSDLNWNTVGWGDTDGSGFVSIPAPTGDFHVSLSPEDLAEMGFIAAPEQQVTLADGETTAVAFRVQSGRSTITGAVRHGANPVSNLLVSLRRNGGEHVATMRSDGTGAFNFPVMAGDYTVQPEGWDLAERGYAPVSSKPALVADATTVTVNFDVIEPDGALTIVLKTPDDAPVVDAWVHINNAIGEYLLDLETDASGTATVGLTANDYRIDISGNLLATHNLMRKEMRQVTVPAGPPHVETITLYPRTARTAADFFLGLITLDGVETSLLDVAGPGGIDIGDVITLFGL